MYVGVCQKKERKDSLIDLFIHKMGSHILPIYKFSPFPPSFHNKRSNPSIHPSKKHDRYLSIYLSIYLYLFVCAHKHCEGFVLHGKTLPCDNDEHMHTHIYIHKYIITHTYTHIYVHMVLVCSFVHSGFCSLKSLRVNEVNQALLKQL